MPVMMYGHKDSLGHMKGVSAPTFPRTQQLTMWKISLVRNLVAASPYADQQEAPWFKEIEGKSFDELGKSGSARFQLLDSQLAAALVKILPDQLRTRVQAKEMDAYKRNTTITGRQIVFMIYEWFKTDAHMSTFFSFNDLEGLV